MVRSRREAVFARYEALGSVRLVADELGVSFQRVAQILRSYGLRSKKSAKTAVVKMEVERTKRERPLRAKAETIRRFMAHWKDLGEQPSTKWVFDHDRALYGRVTKQFNGWKNFYSEQGLTANLSGRAEHLRKIHARRGSKEFCKRGHPMSEAKVYTYKGKQQRHCLACARIRRSRTTQKSSRTG